MQTDILGSRPTDPRELLQEVFGLAAFRPGQLAVVEAQMAGKDVLSVAPTGSGKSISYWIPALSAGGLTLVVSPLIALMKDQVDRLRSLGIRAAFVNSSIDRETQVAELERAESGRLELLYVAPERLSRAGFMQRLGRLPIRRMVVDEAHCISTWGHDFRPDYRLLGEALRACGRPPVAAFTATATPRVRADIAANLEMRSPFVSVTGFTRPNLNLEVQRCRGDAGKRQVLDQVLDPGAGRAIVYTGTVAASEEIAADLALRGLKAAAYHGRLGDDTRRRVQDDFAAGRLRVVVATSAFGMGVDLPDIRQVIHFHLPGSVEAYYQEAGRAGRDGEPARAILLFSPADRQLQAFFIEQSDSGPEQKEHGYARLAQVIAYAHLTTCRHARIADYFGEEGVARSCSACDNCRGGAASTDVPADEADVRVALDALARLGGNVGAANLALTLRGRESAYSRRNQWVSELPFFGKLAGWPEERIRDLLRGMIEAGLATQSHGEYPVVALDRAGREVVAGRADPPPVNLPASSRPIAGKRPSPTVAGVADRAVDQSLLERLREWRTRQAREAGMPAYVIFHDSTLAALAAYRPSTRAELEVVPGLGPVKLERFGRDLLELIADDPQDRPPLDDLPPEPD